MKIKLFIILALLLIMFNSRAFPDIIPQPSIEKPVTPEAYNFQGILSGLGDVNKHTCDLNIVVNDISLPGRGLLPLKITRSYNSKIKKENGKSSSTISAYVDFLCNWEATKYNYYSYSVKEAFLNALSGVTVEISGTPGSMEWNASVNDNFGQYYAVSPGLSDNIKDAYKRIISEGFEIETINHYLDEQQENFGENWLLSINGMSRIYIREFKERRGVEGFYYYTWRYKAYVLNQEHGYTVFTKSGSMPGEWSLSGYGKKTVLKSKQMKFLYDDVNDKYIIITANGIKYSFGLHQTNIITPRVYNAEPHPTHQELKKHISYLTLIEDKYYNSSVSELTNNKITLNYLGGTYKISNIIDARGKSIDFTYTGEVVSSIAYPGDAGSLSINYGYTGNKLTSVQDQAGKNTYFEYYTTGHQQLKEARNDFGAKAVFTYDAESRYEVGDDPNSPPDAPPEEDIVNFVTPDPNYVVTSKEIFEDNNFIRREEYFRTLYYKWTDNDSSDHDDDDLREKFEYANSVVVIKQIGEGTALNKVYGYKYNDMGLLAEVIMPLGYRTINHYNIGASYYNIPTKVINKFYYKDDEEIIDEILNKTEYYFDANIQPDYSLKYKGDDSVHYLKEDYTISNRQAGDFFYYTTDMVEIYDSSDSLLRKTEALYNTNYFDIEYIKKWHNNSPITTTTVIYDSTYPWQIIEIKDAENISTYYGYDTTDHIFLTSIGNSIYSETFGYYPESGRLLRMTDKNNNITELEYDLQGRITKESKPGLDMSTEFAYNDSQRKTTATSKHLTTSLTSKETVYNIFGKPVNEKMYDYSYSPAKELENSYTYNNLGNLYIKTENVTGNANDRLTTVFEYYDLLDRPISIHTPNGMRQYFDYDIDLDNNYEIKESYNSLNEKTVEYYDYLGRMVKKVLTKHDLIGTPEEYITTYTYDAPGQLIEIKQNPSDPNPIIYSKTYDDLGRLLTSTEPGGITTTYTYLDNDKIDTYTNPNGTYSCSYDSIGRQTILQFPNDPAINYYYDDVQQYNYNGSTVMNKGVGLITKIERAGISSSSFVYGKYDRKLKDIKHINELGQDYTTEYRYNTTGNINKIILPDAKEINYTNDNSGNVNSITYNGKTLCSYQYNNLGSIIQKQLNNANINIDYTRYKNNYIQKIDSYNPAVPQNKYLYFEYTYNYNYLASYMNEKENSVSFFYDDITGMLKDVNHTDGSHLNYTYDDFFNRNTFTHDFGGHNYIYETGNNRLDYYELNGKVNAKIDLTYDNMGNIDQEDYLYNNVLRERKDFTFDEQNQLISVSLTNYPENDKLPVLSKTVDYVYDENNMLLKRDNGTEIKYYLYSESGILQAEIKDDGNTVKTYIDGECVIDNTVAEKIFYYIKDYLGNICSIVDENNKRIEYNIYDPFGNIEHSVGESDNQYRFTGKEVDADTGFYYFGARWYDSSIGRFISRDPVMIPDNPMSLNVYVYCYNNPVNYSDPTGMFGLGLDDYLNPGYWDPYVSSDYINSDYNYGYSGNYSYNSMNLPSFNYYDMSYSGNYSYNYQLPPSLNIGSLSGYDVNFSSADSEADISTILWGSGQVVVGGVIAVGSAYYTAQTSGVGSAMGGVAAMKFGLLTLGVGIHNIQQGIYGNTDKVISKETIINNSLPPIIDVVKSLKDYPQKCNNLFKPKEIQPINQNESIFIHIKIK